MKCTLIALFVAVMSIMVHISIIAGSPSTAMLFGSVGVAFAFITSGSFRESTQNYVWPPTPIPTPGRPPNYYTMVDEAQATHSIWFSTLGAGVYQADCIHINSCQTYK